MKLNLDFLEEAEALTPAQEGERRESEAALAQVRAAEQLGSDHIQRLSRELAVASFEEGDLRDMNRRQVEEDCRKAERERQQKNLAISREIRRQESRTRYMAKRRAALGQYRQVYTKPMPQQAIVEPGEDGHRYARWIDRHGVQQRARVIVGRNGRDRIVRDTIVRSKADPASGQDLMPKWRKTQRSAAFRRTVDRRISTVMKLSDNLGPWMKPVRRLDTGRVYESLHEAYRAIRVEQPASGVTKTNIKLAADRGWVCAGTRWEWAKDSPLWGLSKDGKPCLNLDDNLLYPSASEAARSVGVTMPAIKYAMKDPQTRRSGGKRWRSMTWEEYLGRVKT